MKSGETTREPRVGMRRRFIAEVFDEWFEPVREHHLTIDWCKSTHSLAAFLLPLFFSPPFYEGTIFQWHARVFREKGNKGIKHLPISVLVDWNFEIVCLMISNHFSIPLSNDLQEDKCQQWIIGNKLEEQLTIVGCLHFEAHAEQLERGEKLARLLADGTKNRRVLFKWPLFSLFTQSMWKDVPKEQQVQRFDWFCSFCSKSILLFLPLFHPHPLLLFITIHIFTSDHFPISAYLSVFQKVVVTNNVIFDGEGGGVL